MAASLSSRHFTGCKLWSAIVRACSWSLPETLGSDFLENCGLVVPTFLWVSSPGLHTIPGEKFVSSLTNIKEELNSESVLDFSTWSTLRHLREPLHHDLSILSSNSWWEMCSSGKRMRSVRPGGKYRSIRHTKISEIQTGIFGRMERAQKIFYTSSTRPHTSDDKNESASSSVHSKTSGYKNIHAALVDIVYWQYNWKIWPQNCIPWLMIFLTWPVFVKMYSFSVWRNYRLTNFIAYSLFCKGWTHCIFSNPLLTFKFYPQDNHRLCFLIHYFFKYSSNEKIKSFL